MNIQRVQHSESRTVFGNYTVIFPESIFHNYKNLRAVGAPNGGLYLLVDYGDVEHSIESTSPYFYQRTSPHIFNNLDEILCFIIYHQYNEDYRELKNLDYRLDENESDSIVSYIVSTLNLISFDKSATFPFGGLTL